MSNQGRRFGSEDEEARYYLHVLREGSRDEKIEARERLSFIFERRDMLEEACELAEGNARAGVRDRALFTRLASLYRRLGRHDDADAAMAEAATMLGPAPRRAVEPPPGSLAPTQAPQQAQLPSPTPAYAPIQPQKKRSMMKTISLGCVGCAGLLLILGIIGLAFGGSAANQATSTAPTTAPAASAAKPTEPKPAGVAPPVPAEAAKPAEPKPTAKVEQKATGPARVGDRVESGGIALTVSGVQKATSVGQFMRAKPGRTYLTADVTIESVSRENAPYNPLYFKVKDSEGQEHTATAFGPDNSLKSGELPKGDKVRGAVAFDIPSEANGLVLSYQPIVIFGGYQTIRIALD